MSAPARATASSLTIPYYWALAPNYDFTLTPMITTRQGPLLQGEWRHRLVNGSYTIRASGIFQLDKDVFSATAPTPGYRDWRGSVETSGQFTLIDEVGLGLGRHAAHRQDLFPGLRLLQIRVRRQPAAVDARLRRCRSSISRAAATAAIFDVRASTSTASRASTIRSKFRSSIRCWITITSSSSRSSAAKLVLRSNLTSLSRARPPISIRSRTPRSTGGLCAHHERRSGRKNPDQLPAARRARQLHARFDRSARGGAPSSIRIGQMFTPFVIVRADVADDRRHDRSPACPTSSRPAQTDVARHADRRPRVPLSAHQCAVLGHADHRADRPARSSGRTRPASACCRTRMPKA